METTAANIAALLCAPNKSEMVIAPTHKESIRITLLFHSL